MAQVRDFDVSQLGGVLIVCGHYGVGKTALSLSLAKDAARAGKRVTLIERPGAIASGGGHLGDNAGLCRTRLQHRHAGAHGRGCSRD